MSFKREDHRKLGWKLKVSGYGKIKSAEIEVTPLTLFVGDNNSGKSYLMSLIWGIQHFGMSGLLGDGYKADTKAARSIITWMQKQVAEMDRQDISMVGFDEIAEDLQNILQERVDQNRNNLVSKIFNSTDVKIKELQIELIELETTSLIFRRTKVSGKDILFLESFDGTAYALDLLSLKQERYDEDFRRHLIYMVLSLATEIPADDSVGTISRSVYLPAARTGFMLTKDIINKVGRNTAFNIGMSSKEISPFTRPINQFLDIMNDLSFDSRGKKEFDDIVEYLENGMAEGTLDMSTLPNKEVSYVPAGRKKGIPLRVVSAVVTELSPLILILKHKDDLDTLFYEEPEMCLHPQLQHKMGKVICQLVNAGVNMAVTTHSDIILQHMNNIICLAKQENAEEVCKKFGYSSNDLLSEEQIKVYQLKSKSGGKTEVEEMKCGKYGFAIPTFNDALDRIQDEAYAIQE